MPLAPDIVAGVSRRLVEHAGLELPAWVVEARAAARIAALAVSPDTYVALIATARGAKELRELVEAVRVGESSLFRHRSQIAALTEMVVPSLRERGRRAVRVWSAGCASGEEPYTLAIVLARALPGYAISIVATDVSDDALEAARLAVFPSAELADVPEEYRDAFVEEGGHVRVRRELAQLVRFEQANLVDAVPPRSCDVVWCRNVLIYFSAAARRRAIERLVAATVPGGFVFVGYSESLREVAELEPQRSGEAVFYVKRGGVTTPRLPPSAAADAHARRTPPVGVPAVDADASRPPPVGVLAVDPSTRRTPAAGVPLAALPLGAALPEAVLVLAGAPDPAEVTALLAQRFANSNLRRLTIDLDAAVMLEDDLAPVIRRACAAARGAGVEIVIRATRTGARRWVSRHGLDEVTP